MNFANGVKFSMELVTNGNKEEIRATSNVMNAVGYHHVDAIMSKWPILDAKIARRHPLYGYLCKSKAGWMDQGERRLVGEAVWLTLISTLLISDVGLLLISMHSQISSGSTRLQGDTDILCKHIQESD